MYYLSRSTRSWALIVGLQPDTEYYVKVMAYNSAGEGPESERYIGNFNYYKSHLILKLSNVYVPNELNICTITFIDEGVIKSSLCYL